MKEKLSDTMVMGIPKKEEGTVVRASRTSCPSKFGRSYWAAGSSMEMGYSKTRKPENEDLPLRETEGKAYWDAMVMKRWGVESTSL